MAARGRISILALLLGLLIVQTPTLAADKKLPTLGEHEFIPATNIDEPFITTFVQSAVALGQALNMTVPVFDVTDSTLIGTDQSTLFIAGLGFTYQHAPKDWLAVNFDLFTVGRVGTSTSTLLSEGITGGFGYEIGWLMRLYQSESVLLSGSLELSKQQATFINLMDWVQGVLEGEAGPDNPLVRSATSLRGGGGLHFGWGLSRRFGLLSTWKLAYGEAVNGVGSNQWSNDIRMAVSYNALSDIKIPLGLALTSGFFEDDDNGQEEPAGAWFWDVRLGYQSGEDFTIGLDFKTTYVDTDQDSPVQIGQMTIDLRYYF